MLSLDNPVTLLQPGIHGAQEPGVDLGICIKDNNSVTIIFVIFENLLEQPGKGHAFASPRTFIALVDMGTRLTCCFRCVIGTVVSHNVNLKLLGRIVQCPQPPNCGSNNAFLIVSWDGNDEAARWVLLDIGR
jgi:hypothetical protein